MKKITLIALLAVFSAPAIACDPSLSASAGWSDAVACDVMKPQSQSNQPCESLSASAGWSDEVACDGKNRKAIVPATCSPEYLSADDLAIIASVRPNGF